MRIGKGRGGGLGYECYVYKGGEAKAWGDMKIPNAIKRRERNLENIMEGCMCIGRAAVMSLNGKRMMKRFRRDLEREIGKEEREKEKDGRTNGKERTDKKTTSLFHALFLKYVETFLSISFPPSFSAQSAANIEHREGNVERVGRVLLQFK